MRRLLLTCALTLFGCDRAIEVRLVAPDGEVARPVGYDCVDKVEVDVRGTVENTPLCFDVTPGQIVSLRDHNLDGLLDVPVPTGFAAIRIRGVRGNGVACQGDTVFHGEGFYQGGDSLDVTMSRGLDCRRVVTTPTPIQLLSLDAIMAGGAGRCAPPADADQWRLIHQHVFPFLRSPVEVQAAVDAPSAALPVSAAGLATIEGSHFDGAVEPSCQLIDAVEIPTSADFTQVCYSASAPRLCAATGAELITVTSEQSPFNPASPTSIGLVFDQATKAPVSGATVTVVFPDEIPVTYLNYTGTALVASGTAATTSSGLFRVPAGVPIVVAVSRPGQASSVRAVLPDGIFSLGIQPIGVP